MSLSLYFAHARRYLRQWKDHPLMYLHGERQAERDIQGCRLGEICHPVHGTIRVVHVPRLYHHCHPSSKIKLISHMSARSAAIHVRARLTHKVSCDIIWTYYAARGKDWFGGWHSNNRHIIMFFLSRRKFDAASNLFDKLLLLFFINFAINVNKH